MQWQQRTAGVAAAAAVVTLLLAALMQGTAHASAGLVNEDVSRTIDLTTHLANVVTEVTVKNTGSAAVSEYKLADSGVDGTLAYTTAKLAGTEDDLALTKTGVKVDISPGKQANLVVTQVFTHAQTPFPKEIRQMDAQLVKFIGSLYFQSPYVTTSQKTKVLLAGRVESFTKVKPYSNEAQELSFGPYADIQPHTEQELTVHFESYAPFLTTTKLVREVTVSHWGYASVAEDISVVHSGAKLVGEFSRLDYQRDPRASRAAIKSFTTRLPAAASNVYYRDVIGNISTSHLRQEEDAVIIEIEPRFPLFGGWRTQYYLTYDVPSGEILSVADSGYVMSTRFVGHIYDNQVVDEAEVRVVLPEGADNIAVDTPFPVDAQESDVKVTYFDTVGRPVVVLKKTNLVEEHMEDFSVSYTMPPGATLREPIMAVVFFLVLFVAAVALNRLSLSITPDAVATKKQE